MSGDASMCAPGEACDILEDMTKGNEILFSISRPEVYVAFQAQPSSTGADVTGVSTFGWGHVNTIYHDPTNDYANSAVQQDAKGMGDGGAHGGSDRFNQAWIPA